ncbi:MAG: HAMP domain-containing histidine kinase [Elusimicrobia bacterium]|nr:HAMP domain-containing histidine kinase [Elusimicrobiota bacterium]
MTIRLKLALLVSALVTASIGLAAGIQFFGERAARLAETEARLHARAESYAAAAESTLQLGAVDELSRAFQGVAQEHHLLYQSLVRKDGRTLWRESREGLTESINEEGIRAALGTESAYRYERVEGGRSVVEWVIPLKARSEGATGPTGSRPLGVVLRSGFDFDEVRAASAAEAAPAMKRLAVAGLASLLLGLLGATWLSTSITRTIRKLMAGAQQVAAGHFSVRVQTRRGDELGELSNEFNEMGHKLAELESLKDSFLAKITHDLRSPLGAIVCYADVMLMGAQGPLTPKQENSLKLITASGNDLAELINNILDLTKLEAGKMAFTASEVNLKTRAQQVVDLLKVKADEYGVRLDADEIPPNASVWADEQALGRLLSNLVSNSLKFTPKGGRVSLHWTRGQNGEDVIAVKDTGIGIPKDKINTLFQKFSQIEETMHQVRFARGTGLGLAICREIAEGHGGRIWVESEFQKGSTFYVALPAKAQVSA